MLNYWLITIIIEKKKGIASSPPLSGAMEDCSTVRVQQLQMFYRRRCCMSASQRMFGSLWNIVVAHEHRRQDGSRRPGTMAALQEDCIGLCSV